MSSENREPKHQIKGFNKLNNEVSMYDGSLSCDTDNNFSCAQWNENRDLAILSNYLDNSEFSITITQSMLDYNGTAANFISAMLWLAPTAKFGQLLTVYGVEVISRKVALYISGSVSFALSLELSDIITKMLNGGLKVGDTINLKGGKVTSVTIAGNSSGGDANSGNGASSIINQGQTLSDLFTNMDRIVLVCKLVYTKSGDGKLVAQQVCYFQ